MLKHVLAGGIVACTAATAAARPEIQYSSLPAGAPVINFDTLAGTPSLGTGEVLGGQYAGQGVTFSVPNYNGYATNGPLATLSQMQTDPNVIWVDQAGGGGGSSAVGIQANFATPVRRAGAWMGGSSSGTFSIAAYNGNTLLETITHPLSPGGAGQEGFLAIERSEPITRIVLFASNGAGAHWNFAFDDLKYDVGVAPCYPDCNGDHALNLSDFGCFQTKFALGDPYTDCNGDQVLNLSDFGCFQTKFALGCP